MQTTPEKFRNPYSIANKLARAAWSIVHTLLFRPSPWFLGPWRNALLRIFGARLHGFVRFKSSARIWAPWMLEVGDQVYIDDAVYLYNPFGVELRDRVIISQGALLCSATHDYTTPAYTLGGQRIVVESDTWIAAEAFIGPGVTIGAGAVVGARAVVVKDVPGWTVVAGNPAKVIKQRALVAPAAAVETNGKSNAARDVAEPTHL